MFSGIVEVKSKVTSAVQRDEVVELHLTCPPQFSDLSLGDSIAVNGVCLTVEAYSDHDIQFAVANETLQVTGWAAEELKERTLNLERSLRIGDRVHGHFVTGHVDGTGKVTSMRHLGESLLLTIQFGKDMAPFIWRKGSVALNGVSLTINDVSGDEMEFCLIPETLKRTNFGSIAVDEIINIEADFMARGFLRSLELKAGGEQEL